MRDGVARHYETLLGAVYAWSVSGAGDPFARAGAWLSRHGLDRGERYLDLGAGFGAHTVPLCRAGRVVTAVDQDEGLLRQLRRRLEAERLVASVTRADLVEHVAAAAPASIDVVLCLGDTIAHLPERAAVTAMLAAGARVVRPGGAVALSYRDTTRLVAEGTARFHEVARDGRRILHCLVEALDQERVRITDLLTEVGPEGLTTRIGDYLKLRLAPAWVAAAAGEAGLELERAIEDGGLVVQVFRRPA